VTTPQGSAPPNRSGRGWSVAGSVRGVLAVLVVPIVLGPLGIVFGFLGRRRGDRSLGTIAMVISVVGFVVGLVLSAALLTLVGPQVQR